MYVRRSICKPVCEDLSSRVSSHILVLSRSRGMRVFARSYCRTSRNVSAVSHSISLRNDLVSIRPLTVSVTTPPRRCVQRARFREISLCTASTAQALSARCTVVARCRVASDEVRRSHRTGA